MNLDAGHGMNLMMDQLLLPAIRAGSEDIVAMLLQAGADVNTGNGRCLAIAALNNTASMIKLLIDNGANKHAHLDSALFEALAGLNVEGSRVLIRAGANCRQVYGRSSWMRCFGLDSPETIRK